MGRVKSYYLDQSEMDCVDYFDHMLGADVEPEPDEFNEYEQCLREAEDYYGSENRFFKSCKSFYNSTGFLTPKQMYRLRNPRY